jgi:hypothetical protein
MARNASGAYTLPTGNPVVTDTTVTSTWANATMIDVATEMTASLSRTGKGGMLAPLKTINGTAGAPVYTFTNFPTSGWYIAGAGDVRMSITGTDRLKVLATGIEVVGDADIGGKVDVAGTIAVTATAPAVKLIESDGTDGFNETWLVHSGDDLNFQHRDGSGGFLAQLIQLDLKTTGGGGLDLMTVDGPISTTGPVNSNVKLNTKVLEIGDWNMDSTGAIGIAHGLTKTKIRPSVSVLIRADDGDLYGFNADVNATSQTYYSITDTQVFLIRGIGSFFDSTSYDATSFNRGWVTLHYID